MRMILATKNFKTRYIKKLELQNITLITFWRAAFPQMNVLLQKKMKASKNKNTGCY